MDKNKDILPTGENDQEILRKERSALFLQGGRYSFSKENAETFVNGGKSDDERQSAINFLKKGDVTEFEANIVVDLCWDNLENREWIKKDTVMDLLKEKGLNNETKSLRDNWIVEQEILSYKENTTEANIKINIETSDFNLILGNLKEYLHDLEDVLDQADQLVYSGKKLGNESLEKLGNELGDKIVAKIREFQLEHNDIVRAHSKNKLL